MRKAINIFLSIILLVSICINGYLLVSNYVKNQRTQNMQEETISLSGNTVTLNAAITQQETVLEGLQVRLDELANTTLDVRTEHRVLENKISKYETENAELEEFIESEK